LAKSLKQRNQPQLITFVIANVVMLAIIAAGSSRFLATIEGLTKGNVAAVGKFLALPALLTLITGLLGWAMPRRAKETLIYWKTGNNSLPSSRAFTELGPQDSRVDMTTLVVSLGKLPASPSEQTAAWYRIYRRFQQESSVEDAHGAYLKFREMTNLTLALFIGCVLADFILHVAQSLVLWSVLILVCEYLLVMFAARNASIHLVVNVLALESSSSTDVIAGPEFVSKFDKRAGE
jgi:hypothetical protein